MSRDHCNKKSSASKPNILQAALAGALTDWDKNLQAITALAEGSSASNASFNIQPAPSSANLAVVEYDFNLNAVGSGLPNNSYRCKCAAIADPIVAVNLESFYNYNTGFLQLVFNPNALSTIPPALISINGMYPVIIGSVMFAQPAPVNGAMVSLRAANAAALVSNMMQYLYAVPIYEIESGNRYINGFNIVLSPNGINAFMLATNTAGAIASSGTTGATGATGPAGPSGSTSSSSADIAAIATAATVGASEGATEAAIGNMAAIVQESIDSFILSINTIASASSATGSGTAASMLSSSTLNNMAASAITAANASAYESTAMDALNIIINAITTAYSSANNPNLPAGTASGSSTQSAMSIAGSIQDMLGYACSWALSGDAIVIKDVINAIENGTISQGTFSTAYSGAIQDATGAINDAISAGYVANNPTATTAANTAAINAITTTTAKLITDFATATVQTFWLPATAAFGAAQQMTNATATNATATNATATNATATNAIATNVFMTTASAVMPASYILPSSVLVSYELSYFTSVNGNCAVPAPIPATSGYNYLSGMIGGQVNGTPVLFPLELGLAPEHCPQKHC
jgi:hypothetical protein